MLATLDVKLIGPTLAQYEVTGGFVRALRRGEIDAETAATCRD